ncbi:MAG TPA: penicillin-binding protein [Acidobacteriaceae bacterium]|nr:penicillin-binding protein [Acidobacteriaceae bacterium]
MKNTQPQPLIAPIRRLRFVYVAVFFAAWAAIIGLRLVVLQVFEHSEYVEKASRQQQHVFEVPPRRGVLYDRNLHELALTTTVDSVYVVPTEVQDVTQAARVLSHLVHDDPTDSYTSPEQIEKRINASRKFAWVARKVDAKTVERIKALNLKGVYTWGEFKRYYPNSVLAAQTLGYVSLDDKGLGGLEQRFDENLQGTPGRMLTALDARRHVLGSEEREPVPGENLILSIDENIQFMAERALDAALERTHAVSGTVVVQDPHTGEILALAMRPTYNPNDFRHATLETLRNHAVSDVYEPGSTFKLVTYSAALEEKVTTPDSVIDCQNGAITIFGRTIHDSHAGLGRITVSKALWESSDVAAVKLAMAMGKDKFYQYMRSYGFGERSGIELPAETRGLLRQPKKWGATSIGSLAIGQEVGVTPIQLVTMVSSIANGGTYLPPHMVLSSENNSRESGYLKPIPYRGAVDVPNPLPDGAHRVISTMTAAQMRKMMEGIVLFGTGKNAALDGYSSAGKTGTAQKIDVATHTYSKTKYVASFAGFAPVNNPAISVAVIIDSPKGDYYGAAVSAPVFQQVAQQVLEYLGVQHDIDMKPQKAPATLEPEAEDVAVDHIGDLDALYASVNDLPLDDPLRTPPQVVQPNSAGQTAIDAPPAPAAAASHAESATAAVTNQEVPPPGQLVTASLPGPSGSVVVNAGRRVMVPDFLGKPVRGVIEAASASDLDVQVLGSGVARQQAPAAGTAVPAGTEVIVRFSR